MRKEQLISTGCEKVYDFLVAYIKNYGYPPSTKEICIGISLNSTSSVREHLRKLELLGKIKVTPDTSRGIKLVGYQFVKTED